MARKKYRINLYSREQSITIQVRKQLATNLRKFCKNKLVYADFTSALLENCKDNFMIQHSQFIVNSNNNSPFMYYRVVQELNKGGSVAITTLQPPIQDVILILYLKQLQSKQLYEKSDATSQAQSVICLAFKNGRKMCG